MLTCIKLKGKYCLRISKLSQWRLSVNIFGLQNVAIFSYCHILHQMADIGNSFSSPVLAFYQGGDIHRTEQTHKFLWYFFFIVMFPGLERWHIVRRNLRKLGLDLRRAPGRESVSRSKLPILRSQQNAKSAPRPKYCRLPKRSLATKLTKRSSKQWTLTVLTGIP